MDKPSVNYPLIALALSITVLQLILAFGTPELTPFLRYETIPILHGEWYRLLTGHFVHLGTNHTWMNNLAFGMIVILFRSTLNMPNLGISLIVIPLFISLLMLSGSPEVQWYVGLSAYLHGLLVYVVIMDKHLKHWQKLAALAGLTGKISYELLYGASPLTTELINGPVLVISHLWGALSGLAFALLAYTYSTLTKVSTT